MPQVAHQLGSRGMGSFASNLGYVWWSRVIQGSVIDLDLFPSLFASQRCSHLLRSLVSLLGLNWLPVFPSQSAALNPTSNHSEEFKFSFLWSDYISRSLQITSSTVISVRSGTHVMM
jgi:hypothetical protein